MLNLTAVPTAICRCHLGAFLEKCTFPRNIFELRKLQSAAAMNLHRPAFTFSTISTGTVNYPRFLKLPHKKRAIARSSAPTARHQSATRHRSLRRQSWHVICTSLDLKRMTGSLQGQQFQGRWSHVLNVLYPGIKQGNA